MTMVSSGSISLGDVVIEKGGTPTAGGAYGLQSESTTNIDQWSTYKPDGIAPHAISEFYGYNHNQTTTLAPTTTSAPGTTTIAPTTTSTTTTLAPTTLAPGITTLAPTTLSPTTTTLAPTTTTLAPTTTTLAPTTTTTTSSVCYTSSVFVTSVQTSSINACALTPGQGAITLYSTGIETYTDAACSVLAADGYYGANVGTNYYRVNGNILSGPIAC